jgi:glucose/arabinose dehydrogenase
MGIKFYTGKMFPAEYQNTAFIARRGSWNREKPIGFDVVNVREGEGGKLSIQPFITGWSEDKDSYKFWGRPVYIAQMPDGALLVSDEQVGAIYRVSYQKPKAPAKKQ